MDGSMDEAVLLFGTAEPAEPAQRLVAGALSATLQGGNLRHIRIGAVEIIRAVSCVVRDHEWGTAAVEIDGLSVTLGEDRFDVRYQARAEVGAQSYRYEARIEGTPDGVTFRIDGEALTDFLTARLGFVVLHPGTASGRALEVLHVDGSREQAVFPALIEPYQPFMDIRALTHEAAPGLRVTCRMEGDTFEMEDQRNWTDASFKTYVRPIGLPWPYLIPAGARGTQSVSIRVDGAPDAAPATADGEAAVRITVDGAAGTLPALGLQLDAESVLSAEELALLRALRPAQLLVRFGRSHDVASLRRCGEIAEAVGAALHLEAVLPASALTEAALVGEAAWLRAAVDEAGVMVDTVLAVPAADLKGTLPGSAWPECPPLEAVYVAMRRAFPQARLVGGTPCFFTELNRKRPPAALLDAVTFCTSAIVHAADDVTVMENLAAVPAVLASAARIAEGRPLYLGPSGIGCRDNPYGAAAADNAANTRKAMTHSDPRQRGLFAAAWTVGFLAQLSGHDVAAVTLASPVGRFGVIHRDDGRETGYRSGALYPLYHVLRQVASAAGGVAHRVESSAPARVAGLAWRQEGKLTVMLANLTGERLAVSVEAPMPLGPVILEPYATLSIPAGSGV